MTRREFFLCLGVGKICGPLGIKTLSGVPSLGLGAIPNPSSGTPVFFETPVFPRDSNFLEISAGMPNVLYLPPSHQFNGWNVGTFNAYASWYDGVYGGQTWTTNAWSQFRGMP